MEELVKKIYEILKEEISHYKEILTLLQDERKAMVEMDLAFMDKVIILKTKRIVLIKKLEQERLKKLEELKVLLDMKETVLNLRRLAEIIYEPYSSQLKNCHSILKSLLGSISELNSINTGLASVSLKGIRQKINFIKNQDNLKIYGQKGGLNDKKMAGNLIKMEL